MRRALLVALLLGCGGTSSQPPAATPILTAVLRPGSTPVAVTADPTGSFPVLPSPSAIIRFLAPYPTTLEVTVAGVVVEQTNSLPRQQTLDAQGLGYWYHLANSPDVSGTGTPRWEIAVVPPIPLRKSTGFPILLVDTSTNTTSTRSSSLMVSLVLQATDFLDFVPNAGNDDVVVLLDGRRASGCVDDELWRVSRMTDVGSVLGKGVCNEELFAFSTGDAVMLFDRTIAGTWSDPVRDVVTVPLTPLVQVPVDVWLLGPGLRSRVTADFARANAVYDTSRCGVTFVPNIIDQSTNTTAITLFGTNLPAMENASWRTALTGSAFFTAGRLNVYYVGGPFTGRNASGFNASPYNENIIGIDTTANNETLAHELGHSFTLLHSNPDPAIPATNIMFAGGSVTRTEFTEGQCYRMNVNTKSALNTDGTRGGFIRDCPDNATNPTCPALSFDVPN